MEKNRIVLHGSPASKGLAAAKAYVYTPLVLTVREDTFPAEQEREQQTAFRVICEKAAEELEHLYDTLAKTDEDKAKIFLAHKELLEDEELLDEVQLAISEGMYPDAAVQKVFTEFSGLLAKVDNPLIAGRAVDLLDVRNRLVRIYQGKEEKNLSSFEENVILVARALLPSDTATLDRCHVKGIVTELGGENSHSAILARSFGIPAVLHVARAMEVILDGSQVLLDGNAGSLVICPEAAEQEAFVTACEEERQRKERTEAYRRKPTVTKDGCVVDIGLNIGAPEIDESPEAYDFVGLFRSEFLYMGNTGFPTEEEQFQAYKKALLQAGGKPVTLRTLDIGGDKTLPYYELPKEENPFLGKRALRLCLSEPELFLTQLRAALRASAFGPLQLMFPMVGSMEDIDRTKEFVETAKRQLREQKHAFDENIKLGIMIEIPSIALLADLAAKEVDFASVGSNDLTQYLCAADRMNEEISNCYQSLSPAMLRTLRFVFEAFAKEGKPVSVCGEMAGKPEAALLLVGLGARKLSMSAGALAEVKAAVATHSLDEIRALTEKCLACRTEEEIKNILK